MQPQWICLNCKTVIGPIIDEDQCGCGDYEYLVRMIEDNRDDIKLSIQAYLNGNISSDTALTQINNILKK